jgi:hypothetical protein
MREELGMLARKFAAIAYHAEFDEAVYEEVTEDTQLLESPETLQVLLNTLLQSGLEFEKSDFLNLAIDRQSEILLHSCSDNNSNKAAFVATVDTDPFPGRSTMGDLPEEIRLEKQRCIISKVIFDGFEAADGRETLSFISNDLRNNDVVLCEKLRGRDLNGLHVLCHSDEYPEATVKPVVRDIRDISVFHTQACQANLIYI